MPPTAPPRVVLAFDVGGTTVKAAAFDGDLHRLADIRLPSRRGPEIIDVLGDAADSLLADLGPAASSVAAAGVVVPGLVDPANGVSLHSVNLGLNDLDIAGPLSARLGVPVALAHDVGAAAAAVQRRCDATDPFVVVLGTGIAGVAFVRGVAVAGVSGQAGELGHVVVRPDGPLCACGARGCLEAVAGAAALLRRYQDLTGRPVEDVRQLVALTDTDDDAAAIWTEAVAALADALTGVCALLAPGAIVLAGGLAEAGVALTAPLTVLLKERARVTALPPVVVSELGASAGVVGAAEIALDLVDGSPA